MFDQENVVYKLDLGDHGVTLAFVDIESRKFLSHDQMMELPGIPECFAPATISGSRGRGYFKLTRGTPMMSMGAMVDAGYKAFEDIDRLEEIAAARRAEKEAEEKFIQGMRDLYAKASADLAKLPHKKPPSVKDAVARVADHFIRKRKRNLTVEKVEAMHDVFAQRARGVNTGLAAQHKIH